MQNKEMFYFKLFRDVCKVINSSLDLKEVLILITENIVKLINVKGLKSSIEVLKTMKEVQAHRSTRRTPYEGVPRSVSSGEFVEQE